MFDGNFPQACHADHGFVVRIGNQITRRSRQFRIVYNGPQGDERVEQQPHPERPANNSAMAAASTSISSGTVNFPLATPIRLPRDAGLIATSLAAGRPLRAMMISVSAPLSTAATRRERLDLACSILTVGIGACAARPD